MATLSITEWVSALNNVIPKVPVLVNLGAAVTLQPNGDVEYSIIENGERKLVSLTWLIRQLNPADQKAVNAFRANNDWAP
jgi:hypothetical protein